MTSHHRERQRQEENVKRIFRAFAELALERSYYDITIGDIARVAGLSTSSFYVYFRSKEDMLRKFAEYVLEILNEFVISVRNSPSDLSEKVRVIIKRLSGVDHQDKILMAFHRVFRELEFINLELSHRYYTKALSVLEDLFKDYLKDRRLMRVLSISMVGISHFVNLYYDVLRARVNRDLLLETAGDIVLKGLVLDKRDDVEKLIPPPKEVEDFLDLAKSYGILDSVVNVEAKKRFLKAALSVLSKKSFREAKVFEISSLAGYSVGMFYKNYKSKNEILIDIIKVLNKTIRRYLTLCTSKARDGLEVQIVGLGCFLDLVKTNHPLYKIIRESEYIDPSIAGLYYIPFAERYAEKLRERASRGEIVTYDPFSTAIVLMGVTHSASVASPILGIIERDEILKGVAEIYGIGLLRIIS